MTAGFYKYESDILFCGPNFVLSLEYELRAESKDEYTYPVDGWHWFNSIEEACLFFNIPSPDNNKEEVSNESI